MATAKMIPMKEAVTKKTTNRRICSSTSESDFKNVPSASEWLSISKPIQFNWALEWISITGPFHFNWAVSRGRSVFWAKKGLGIWQTARLFLSFLPLYSLPLTLSPQLTSENCNFLILNCESKHYEFVMWSQRWYVERFCSTWQTQVLLHRQCLRRLQQIWFMSEPWRSICNFCDTYCWWGIVLKRRIFPGMSGMIRVNLLKPVSSYFSCHFRTVMLLPKLSLFILLASLFLLFLRQWWLFTCGQMLCQSQASRRGWKMCHLTTVVRSNIFRIQIVGCSMYSE